MIYLDNQTRFTIRLRRMSSSDLASALKLGYEGEPLYITDTGDLYIADSNYAFDKFPSLKNAVVNNGEILTFNGEIIYN